MQPNTPPPSGDDVAGSSIFKKFLGKAEGYIQQPTRMKQLLVDAYQKASEKNEVGSLANEGYTLLKTLFRLIKASISGEYTGVPGTTVAAAVAVLIYFLSPLDIIPDIIPVLGLLDDMALIAWFSTTIKSEIDKFHEWELTRPTVAEPATDEAPTHANAIARHGHSSPAPATTAAPVNTDAAVPAPESAKHAGTDSINPPQSNTDAGLGSPDSSAPAATPEAGSAAPAPQADVAATTTDSSREPNDGAADTGGNIR